MKKRFFSISIIVALMAATQLHAQVDSKDYSKNPPVNKGSRNEHHGERLPGDHHKTGDYKKVGVPGGKGSPEVVNKGPKNVYHGVNDPGHSHRYNRGENAAVYKYTHRYRGPDRPVWAVSQDYRFEDHIYFPTYYTFYDARRNGYYYWDNMRWNFSEAVPAAMLGAKMDEVEIIRMRNVSLKENPFLYFEEYYKAYPPQIIVDAPHPPLPVL